MTSPEVRPDFAELYSDALAETRRAVAGTKLALDETKRVVAGTKLVLDEWERESRVMSETFAQLRATVAAHIRSLDPSVEAWVSDEVLRALGGKQTARRRAYAALGDIKGQGLIDSGAFDRGMKLVDILFTPNTIYCSIAPDDGGVTFYWRAADMSIEIDIYSGEGYWWRVRNVAAENYSGHGGELPIDALKYSLTWFSKEVDRENPHWRQQTT